jgi:hypothetical protein
MAQGPKAVAVKLARLIHSAKTMEGAGALSPQELAERYLSESRQQALAQIGDNVELKTPMRQAHVEIHGTPSDSTIDQIYDKLVQIKGTKQQVFNFLTRFDDEQERELAARVLADGADYKSFRQQLDRAARLNDKILQLAKSKGVDPGKILFVTDLDAGGSSHMSNYLYKQANNVPSSQFVSENELREMAKLGNLKDKMVVYLDDITYSGSQGKTALWKLPAAKEIVLGFAGAYTKGIEDIGPKLGVNQHLLYVDHLQGLFGDASEFNQALTPEERIVLNKIVGGQGFGTVGAAQAMSHMFPDNDVDLMKDFADQVLNLPYS